MKKQNNSWAIVALIVLFLIMLMIYVQFPKTEFVDRNCSDFGCPENSSCLDSGICYELEVIEHNITITETEILEVPFFSYGQFINASWEIVFEEFDNELEECGNESYDLDDEVTFEFREDAKFVGWIDWDRGKFEICYKVDAEYDDGDDDCEQVFKICHKFKNFEPRDEDYVNVSVI